MAFPDFGKWTLPRLALPKDDGASSMRAAIETLLDRFYLIVFSVSRVHDSVARVARDSVSLPGNPFGMYAVPPAHRLPLRLGSKPDCPVAYFSRPETLMQ
jgi:hypothetical protein